MKNDSCKFVKYYRIKNKIWEFYRGIQNILYMSVNNQGVSELAFDVKWTIVPY